MFLDVFSLLAEKQKIFVILQRNFTTLLQQRINQRYHSIHQAAKHFGYKTPAFRWALRHSRMELKKVIHICAETGIDENTLRNAIQGYYMWGSKKPPRKIPTRIEMTETLAVGCGLFLAEGDTGINGRTTPTKIRFTNSNPDIIHFYLEWTKYFGCNTISTIDAYLPKGTKTHPSINKSSVPTRKLSGKHCKIPKYRVITYSALHHTLLRETIRATMTIARNNTRIAQAFVTGIYAGEGTVRCARERYTRIEMKNKRIIEFISNVLRKSHIEHRMHQRRDRQNMWCIYIGAKELHKFSQEIGYGPHTERQKLLEHAASGTAKERR